MSTTAGAVSGRFGAHCSCSAYAQVLERIISHLLGPISQLPCLCSSFLCLAQMLLEIRDLQRRHAKNTNTSIANLGHNEPLEQTSLRIQAGKDKMHVFPSLLRDVYSKFARCASQVSK
jgi:hypothetical protein